MNKQLEEILRHGAPMLGGALTPMMQQAAQTMANHRLNEEFQKVALWASQGVWEALTTTDTLDVARARVVQAPRGSHHWEVFTCSFEWARERRNSK